MPLTVGGCKQSTSCKADRSDRLESHQRGFKPRRSFYMQETVNWSSELTLSREKVVMSEEWKAQYNKAGRLWFFGGRCSGKPRGNPWSQITPLRFVWLPSSWPLPRAGFLTLAPGTREGNSNPFQYSCLESSMDRGAWQATYSPWARKESNTTEVT